MLHELSHALHSKFVKDIEIRIIINDRMFVKGEKKQLLRGDWF